MEVLYDYFGFPEDPSFTLCNPNKEELYSLGTIYDRVYKPRYNAFSELSFIAPEYVDGDLNEWYSYLTYRRLVLIDDSNYFMITGIDEDNNGLIKEKKITAQSLEVEFALKDITYYEGTYKFYDPITPEGTLLQDLVDRVPGWTVGDVDTSLAVLYRTFDVSESTIYEFMMNDVEETYQCIFVFDTVNKIVDAHTIDNATTETDIVLSFDNLVENVQINEVTEELITALTVYGGGALSINQVNPLGTNTIYNFDYYKSTDWMSQDLVDAITDWETEIDSNQSNYSTLLTSLLNYNATLITQEADLVTLNSEYKALEGVQLARIEQGLSLTAVKALLVSKQSEIDSKQSDIDSTNLTIASITSQLTSINSDVSFANNFTSAQLILLSPFVVGQTYQNENFIQTDEMTNVEIQDMAQDLYDQAVSILTKVSQPRYEFNMSVINFLQLQDFDSFTDELEMGSIVNLELTEDTYIYPALLGFDLDYDNPDNFSMIFSNRLRLDDGSYRYSDLFKNTVKSSIKTNFDSLNWGNFDKNYKDDVSTFMDSALDAAVNNVISGSNQDILFDQNGLRIRKSDGSSYEDEQIWMNNGIIAFTENNWATSSLALGEITTGSATSFGLIADELCSRKILGVNFVNNKAC